MVLHGKIEFAKALAVDEKLLKELESVLSEYYDDITYNVWLINGNRVRFESLEELIDYDNFEERRISRLMITMEYTNEIIFDTTISPINSYKNTVVVTYCMNDSDKSHIFNKKVKSILEKHKRTTSYTAFTKISTIYFCIAGLIASSISYIYSWATGIATETTTLTYSVIVNGTIFSVIVLIFIFWILSKARIKIAPPITFKIGCEIKEDEKREKLRGNILWGVIIATIAPVVFSFIASLIST